MKHFNIVVRFFVVILLFSCQLNGQQSEGEFYGETFKAETVATKSDKLKMLSAKDSISIQMEGKIVEVCQAKGCWMKVDLTDGEQVFVRFKDYGFFVPTDSAEKSTVLNGVAFIEEMSVEDQKHYAADKGASKEELAQITKPKKTYRFEAEGVLIKSE